MFRFLPVRERNRRSSLCSSHHSFAPRGLSWEVPAAVVVVAPGMWPADAARAKMWAISPQLSVCWQSALG